MYMVIANHPAILPPDLKDQKDLIPVSRPLDPELSNSYFAMNNEMSSFSMRVKDTTYTVKMIKDWAERSEAPNSTKPVYVETVERPIQPHIQVGNTCGPTSLTMVLTGLGVKTGADSVANLTHCSSKIGTSPIDIRDTAREYGLNSVILNNSSSQAVLNILNAKGTCIALIQQSGALHYVVINGYRKSEAGNIEYLVNDPNGPQFYQSASSFDSAWANPTLKGVDIGLHRCIIAVSKEELPAEQFGGYGQFLAEAHSMVNKVTQAITGILQSAAFAAALLVVGKRRQKAKTQIKTASQ